MPQLLLMRDCMSCCLFKDFISPPSAMQSAVTIELLPDPLGPTVTLKFGPRSKFKLNKIVAFFKF